MKFFINLKIFIKEHHLIIALSFLLTILIFAPLFVFPLVAKNEYQGLNINWFGTDAHFYLTKGKEILDGNALASPVLREGKDGSDPYVSYSEYILLTPIKLLGLAQRVDITTIYNIYAFISSFFIVILIYFLVLQLSGRKLLSIAAALFVVGGYSLIYYKTLFYTNFNIYARVIYPFFSSLVLFVYLNFLVKSLNSKKLKYKILAGVFFGLLFYVYFYAWSFVLALNGCLFLILSLKRDFFSAKKVLLISSIGLTLGIYNLINLFSSPLAESGNQMTYFLWVIYSHGPVFSKIGLITLAIFAVYYYKRRDDKNWPLILAIILSGWISLNQQIITGRMVQYGHYYWYFIVPLSIVISFYMIWGLVNNKKLRKYLFLFLIAVAFINTIGGQYKSFWITFDVKKYEQNFRPLIDVLNKEPVPTVVLMSDANAYLITIYTPHDLFWHGVATISNIPEQRLKDALFVYTYLNQEATDDFAGYLEKISIGNESKDNLYRNLYRNLEGLWSGFDYYIYRNKLNSNDSEIIQKRPEIINRLNEEYNKIMINNNGIDVLLKKYGVKYIVWDKNKNPEWDLSSLQNLKEIVCSNNICLYNLVN